MFKIGNLYKSTFLLNPEDCLLMFDNKKLGPDIYYMFLFKNKIIGFLKSNIILNNLTYVA